MHENRIKPTPHHTRGCIGLRLRALSAVTVSADSRGLVVVLVHSRLPAAAVYEGYSNYHGMGRVTKLKNRASY